MSPDVSLGSRDQCFSSTRTVFLLLSEVFFIFHLYIYCSFLFVYFFTKRIQPPSQDLSPSAGVSLMLNLLRDVLSGGHIVDAKPTDVAQVVDRVVDPLMEAIQETAAQAIHLKALLTELGEKLVTPTTIRSESRAAHDSLKTANFYKRLKHVTVALQWVCKQLANNIVEILHVET